MDYKCIFIDESGQREYGESTDPYFVNCGLIINKSDIAEYEHELKGIKRAFLGDPLVELKSNWLRRPKKAAERYLQRYNIKEERLKIFVEAVYRWVENIKLVIIASVIDKPAVQKKYVKPMHPSALAYLFLMQRYHKYLEENGAKGEVIFDDLSGKSKAGNEWKKLLCRQHKLLQDKCCPFTKMIFPRLKGELVFKESSELSLLQLSDLAAYNVFRQMRDYGEDWKSPKTREVTVYDWLDKIVNKFRISDNGIISGYGIVVFPDESRHKWKVIDGLTKNEKMRETESTYRQTLTG